MAAMLGTELRLLLSLRHPVHRAVSEYFHYVCRAARTEVNPLRESLNEFAILEASRYGAHLTRWWKVFGRQNIRVVFYENLFTRRQQVFNRITDWLQIPSIKLPDGQRLHNTGPDIRLREGAIELVPVSESPRNLSLQEKNDERREGRPLVMPAITQTDLDTLSDALKPALQFVRREFGPANVPWKDSVTVQDILASAQRLRSLKLAKTLTA